MVFSFKVKRLIFLLFCFCFFSFGMLGCTSSDDDVSVLEDGLSDIDTEIDSDLSDDEEDDDEFADSEEDEDIEDDEDMELAQLDDEFNDEEDKDEEDKDEESDDDEDEDDEFADLDEDDDEDLDDEDEDDEFADLDDEDDDEDLDDEDEDDEFADLDDEDDDDEFADLDDDEDFDDEDEDDEFADLDDEDEDDDDDEEIAQNEESLGEELKQGEGTSESEFPEQVVGQEGKQKEGASSDSMVVGQGEDPSLPQDDLGEADPISEGQEEAPQWVPVVKIRTDTEYRNGRLINTVYIVRPQDTMESISEKIYGDQTKVKELNANNLHLAKGIDPGDKVYYNSPNRPEDKSQLKFFYDDVGLEPQIYMTKENDNMRKLGSRLLGFADGWKEIWATNQNVDSKTILPGGLQLRYWTGNEPPVSVAEVTPEEVEPPVKEESMGVSEEIPIEEPQDIGAIGKVNETFPKEPNIPAEPLPEPQMNMPENDLEPVADTEAFSEPEAEMEGETEIPQTSASSGEPESLVSVGALALILLAGLVLVVIQIKKRSNATTLNPSSLEYTQV